MVYPITRVLLEGVRRDDPDLFKKARGALMEDLRGYYEYVGCDVVVRRVTTENGRTLTTSRPRNSHDDDGLTVLVSVIVEYEIVPR